AVLRVSAEAAGERKPATLHVEVLGEGLGEEHLAEGVRLAERVFATGTDVQALERDVAADPVFAAVAARFRGLRPVLIADHFEALGRLPAEEAVARLGALKGVGRWTAEYVLMRGLGFPDVLPAGDGGLRRIIGREYGLGRLATEPEVRAVGAAWAGWRSYAA